MVAPLDAIFPGLRATPFRVTSPATRKYNCIAWAAGDTTRWWWPAVDSDNDSVYWPSGVPIEETVAAFTAAFATLGYVVCSSEAIEADFEKVAFFADASGPTHAARQLPNGRWTSKLGFQEDIEHELHAISGEVYGDVQLILKRRINVP